MKKLLTLAIVFVFLIFEYGLFAQSPNSFSYQAVIRNANNQIQINQNIGIRLSILKTSSSGTISYSETHNISTNQFGMINLFVGNGTPISGSFANINWGSDNYFMKVDIDINGGNNYQFMGTTQLMSVPYSLHSRTADNITGTITENDPLFAISIASTINSSDTSNWNNKLDSESDPIFAASIANSITQADTLSWNSKLDSESDPIFATSIANSITQADTLNWNSKLDSEVDGSVTNELQALSLSNDTLYLSNGNQVYLGGSQNIWTKQGDTVSYNNGLVGINTYSYDARLTVDDFNTSDTTTTIYAHANGGVAILGKNISKSNHDWSNIGIEGQADIDAGTRGRGISGFIYGNGSGSGSGGYGVRGDAKTDFGWNTGVSGYALSKTGNTKDQNGGVFIAQGDWNTNNGIGTGVHQGVYARAIGGGWNCGIAGDAISRDGNNQDQFGGIFTAQADWDTTNGVGTGNHYGIRSKASGGGYWNLGIEARAQGSSSTGNNHGGEFWGMSDVQTNGYNYGIRAEADSSTNVNRGVFAIVSSDIGQWNQGGLFVSDGTGNTTIQYSQNVGVYGYSKNNWNSNYGVKGKAIAGSKYPSAFLTGIYGLASGYGGGDGYGVDGSNNSRNKKNVGVGGFAYGNVSGDSINVGVYGYGTNADTNYAMYADAIYTGNVNYGIYAEAANGSVDNHAGFFEGDVTVTGDLNVIGSISKGSGTFKIDHPTDPENKFLVHSFVESPDMMNVYSGNITTDADGLAVITLPGYFAEINKDFRYQLTCIGVFTQAIVKEKISGNSFTIQTEKANVEVSWQITAVRNDKYAQQHRVVVEQEKSKYERGKYLHPELYEKGVKSRIYPKHYSGGAEMMRTKLENDKNSKEAISVEDIKKMPKYIPRANPTNHKTK